MKITPKRGGWFYSRDPLELEKFSTPLGEFR